MSMPFDANERRRLDTPRKPVIVHRYGMPLRAHVRISGFGSNCRDAMPVASGRHLARFLEETKRRPCARPPARMLLLESSRLIRRTMIRILNDLKTICAWGKWCVGHARNEPRVALVHGQRRDLRVAAQSAFPSYPQGSCAPVNPGERQR